jgi:Zn-dependent peptidase ImmA (M78 family)
MPTEEGETEMNTTVPALLSTSALATFLREHHGFDMLASALPIDVDKIANLLGIQVSESPNPQQQDTIGKITLCEEKPALVWINPSENAYAPRRRFTLAHEIGHFCMHRSTDRHEFIDDKRSMNRSESYWNRFESEANRFAANLLMPKELVETVGRKVIDTYKTEHGVTKMPLGQFIEIMARRFGVSSPAMEYRLNSLGIGKRT